MFRENKHHLQDQLFSSYTQLDGKIQKRLQNSWAPLYYEHVFCKIDEMPFAKLYCEDNGRPNFPVNILLSLEFIKHFKDFSDEELIEQFYFNYQILYALGLRNLGELYLAPRTLYEFRERVCNYTVANPQEEDLIFQQFEHLTEHFLKALGLDTKEQRTDSTQVMSNIKKAGRLSLAYDVLVQAINVCPLDTLPDALKEVLQPSFKTDLLYRSKGGDVHRRLEEILALCSLLLDTVGVYPNLLSLDAVVLVRRLLTEQSDFDVEQKQWKAKPNKDVAAHSLQSAYDPDATYRKKGGNGYSGYVANITETCAEENPVQLITDYTLEKNSASDNKMLQDRLDDIKERTELTDMYADGAYYSEDMARQDSGVTIHYTDMTGNTPSPEKLSLSAFVIEKNEIIISCPGGQEATRSRFKKKTEILTAHFDLEKCQTCPMHEACPVKFQKKEAVLRVSQKSVLAAKTRQRIRCERKENTSKRAAIEGTNSVLKRRYGVDKLDVRGHVKSKLVFGMKVIAHNFNQVKRCMQGNFRRKPRRRLALVPAV